MPYEQMKELIKQLRINIQDSIDEELEKVVPRDDQKFMEMRKMNPVTIQGGGEVWKPSDKPYALCPPKKEREKKDAVQNKE